MQEDMILDDEDKAGNPRLPSIYETIIGMHDHPITPQIGIAISSSDLSTELLSDLAAMIRPNRANPFFVNTTPPFYGNGMFGGTAPSSLLRDTYQTMGMFPAPKSPETIVNNNNATPKDSAENSSSSPRMGFRPDIPDVD